MIAVTMPACASHAAASAASTGPISDRRGEITLWDRASTPAVAGLPAYPGADLAKGRSNFHKHFEDMRRTPADAPS